MRRGFSRGNNPNDHAAKRVNNNQDPSQKIPANGDEAVFAFMLIFYRDSVFIFKDATASANLMRCFL